MYTEFSSGRIDGGLPISDEYLGTAVQVFVGPKKAELTLVNSEFTVGKMISALGQYVEYSVSMLPLEELDTETREDALAILMIGTQQDLICLISGELNYQTRS